MGNIEKFKKPFIGIALLFLMLHVVLSETDNKRKFLLCFFCAMEYL